MDNASDIDGGLGASTVAWHYNEWNMSSLTIVYDVLSTINLIYIPLLILFGTFGNIVSIIVIFGSKLRYIPPNLYLAFLCASDTAFLISLIPVWFSLMQSMVEQRSTVSLFMCRAHVYVMNCASWLSSWIVMALTIERLAVVVQRGRFISKSSSDRARWVTAAIFPLPLVFNSYVFFWVGLLDEGGCDMLPEYDSYGIVISAADTFLVFLLPLLVNLIANGNVFARLWKGRSPMTRLIIRNTQSSLRRYIHTDHVSRQRQQLTKILIAVPMVFLMLNLPSYSLRIYHFIDQFVRYVQGDNGPKVIGPFAAIISEIALLLNYTNFGINFVVYCVVSRSFRTAPSKLIRRRAMRFGAKFPSNQNSFSRRAQRARPSVGYFGEPTADAEPARSATRPHNHLAPDDYELLTTASSCTRTNSPRNSNAQSDFIAISTVVTNF